MATVRDKKKIEPSPPEDRRTFVFNWLSTPFQKKREGEDLDMSTRIEDILDELQDNRDSATMKIRLK